MEKISNLHCKKIKTPIIMKDHSAGIPPPQKGASKKKSSHWFSSPFGSPNTALPWAGLANAASLPL